MIEENIKVDDSTKEFLVFSAKLINGQLHIQIGVNHFPTLLWALKMAEVQIENMMVKAEVEAKPKVISPDSKFGGLKLNNFLRRQ